MGREGDGDIHIYNIYTTLEREEEVERGNEREKVRGERGNERERERVRR